MGNFNIKERQDGEVTVLDLDGDMRIGESLVMFQRTIRRLLEEGRRKILLNLAGVEYIDSSGLGEIIASHNALDKKDGQIKLLHLTRRVRELMVITKLLTVFDVYEDESESLNSFKNPTTKLEEHPQALLTKPYYETRPREWGESGMSVTFRAEVMPGRSHLERTFSVKKLLPSGRVMLNSLQGQYVEWTFEPVQYSAR